MPPCADLMVGDSWMRQLMLNFVRVISPDPPVEYFFGGAATGPMRNDPFCKYGGAGPGVDFPRCGWPGNTTWVHRNAATGAVDTAVVYAHKGYVDTPKLDVAYARFADAAGVDALLYDVGRWGSRPSSSGGGGGGGRLPHGAPTLSMPRVAGKNRRRGSGGGGSGGGGSGGGGSGGEEDLSLSRYEMLLVDSLRRICATYKRGPVVLVWGGARDAEVRQRQQSLANGTAGSSRRALRPTYTAGPDTQKRVATGNKLDAKKKALEPLSRALRRALRTDQQFDRVIILDRFKSMVGIPASWPARRFSGHGFSGPITDLHARLLLALVCSVTSVSGFKAADRGGAMQLRPEAPQHGGVGISRTGDSKEDRCFYEKGSKPSAYPAWVRYYDS